MSYKFGTALVPGAYHYGAGGLGIAGALVPFDGEAGASYLYNDLVLPADAEKEVRGLIETLPVGLTSFAAEEDGSFTAVGPDGIYTFVYRLYVDGVDSGTALVTFNLGATTSGSLTGAITLADAIASGLLGEPGSLSGNVTLADVLAAGELSRPGALSGGVDLGALVASGSLIGVEPAIVLARSRQGGRIIETARRPRYRN